MYPNCFNLSLLFRQFLSTFTRKSRNTLTPKNSSNFPRASTPTSLIFCPPFPTTMPFCESRSTSIIAPIRTSGRFFLLLLFTTPYKSSSSSSSSPAYRSDSSNVSTLTSQQYGNSFPKFSNSVSRINSEAQNRSVRSVKKSGWYNGGPTGNIALASLFEIIFLVAANIAGSGLPNPRMALPTSTFGSFARRMERSATTPGSFGPSAAQVGRMAKASGRADLHFWMVWTAFAGVLTYTEEEGDFFFFFSPLFCSTMLSPSSSATRSTLLTHTMTGLYACRNFIIVSSGSPKSPSVAVPSSSSSSSSSSSPSFFFSNPL
mmetsp:Transcript_42622/g.89417  ORF Transcript_42622/g.89417 Transcript_42622/m.89417 type:complete len:317 (-) Transcript_42622:827-1777(-)